jgi:hypothetical protein
LLYFSINIPAKVWRIDVERIDVEAAGMKNQHVLGFDIKNQHYYRRGHII